MFLQEDGSPLARKRLEMVFRDHSLALWSGLMISAAPVLAHWLVTDRAVLLGWMLMLWLELALRYLHARRFMHSACGTDTRKWRFGVTAFAAIDGAFWGMSVWLLPVTPTGPATTLLLVIIASSAAFDSRALAAVPTAALASLATTLLPVAFWLLTFGAPLTTLMGVATLLYLAVMLIFLRQSYHSINRLLSSTERNEQLAAEQRESEWRMARYFESAPGYFYTLVCRPDGSYAMPFASAGIREIFGLEPEAVVQDISALVALDHPDDLEMVFRKTEESARELTPFHIEYRIIHPQKGLRWIEVNSLPQRMPDGGTRWDGFMHDITERKQAEEKHSALQRQLQIIADNLPGAVTCNRMFPDGSGKVLYANKGLQDVFGFTQQDLADDITPMAWRIHPEDLPQAAEKMIAAAKALSTYTGEFRVNHPDKGEIWVQQTSTPVYESESSMLWYGLMFDITERKQAEQQLKEALAFNEGIINAIPDILFEMDRDGRYLNFWTQDPVAREVNKTALLGKTVFEVLSREVAEEAMTAIREADEKGSAYGKAIPIVQPDGEVRWYEHSLSKKIGRSPTEATILAVSRDVTERKRMEIEVKQREAEFRALAENLPNPIFRYDRDCRRVYANPVAVRISAMQVEELLGNTPLNSATMTPESAVRALEAIREVFATNERREIYVEYTNGDGKTREYKAQAVPEYDSNGQVETALAILHEVTDLREAERRAASFFSTMPGFAFTFRLTPEGRMSFPFASRGIEEFYGLRPDEVRDDAAPLLALAHPDDHPRILAAIAESAQTLQPLQVEVRVQRPGLPERWIEARAMPEREADGDVLGQGIMLDITERKRAEEELRRTAEFQNSLLVGIRDSGTLLAVIENGRVVFFGNRDIAHQLGFSDEAIAAHPNFIDVVHPDDRDRIADLYRRRLNGEPVPSTYELGLMLPDGSRREYEVAVVVVPDTDPVRSIHILRDITERKRMEDSLRVRENEYRTLAENFPDVVIRYGRDYRRIYVNPAFTELAGNNEAELIGRLPQEASPLLDMDAYMAELRKAMESGIASSGVIPVRRANGEDGWYMGSFVPEFDAGGKVVGVLMVARDITERKRMEQALQEREAQQRQQNNLLRSILESASSVGIYAVDREYRFLAFNRQFSEGAKRLWNADVSVGMSMLDAIDTDAHREFCRRGFDYVLAGNNFFLESQEAVVKDGISTFEHHDNYASPIRDENGTVIGLTVFTANTTERKKTANQLEEMRTRLQTVLHTLPDMVWLKDADGVYLACNHVFERCFGATEAEIVGKTDYDFVDAELADFFRQKDREAIEAGRICINEEWVTIAADGCSALLETRKVPVYGEDGRVTGVLGVARDITERKRMEEALRAREHEYRTLTENLPDFVIRYDRDCRRIHINRGVAALVGVAPNEAIGKTPAEGSPVVDAEAYMAEMRKAMELGMTTRMEFAARVAPGEIGWHLGSFVPEFDAAGNVSGVLVVGRDITDRKRMEAALQASESKHRQKSNLLHSLMDSASDVVVYALDLNYRYLSFNRKHSETYKRLWGVDIAIGMNMLDIITREEFREFCRQGFDYVLAGNSFAVESQEESMRDGRLTREYWENYGSPIRNDDGNVIGLTVFAVDVTKRRQAELALENSRAQLRGLIVQREKAREEERKLIAREVHDELGQILTGLKLNVAAMGRKFAADSEPLRKQVQEISALTESAIGVARDISTTLRPAELDMGVIASVKWLAGRWSAYAGVACRVYSDKEIHLQESHAVAVFRIVQESLTNIAKHAQASRVDIRIEQDAGGHVLKIRDNGHGFDPRTEKQGSFGLVGMRERALMLGGDLDIKSKPGSGTELVVTIPAQNNQEES